MAIALIDNATLFGASRLFINPFASLQISDTHLQSLDSFLEAYVLNGFPFSVSLGLARNESVPKYLKMFKHFLYRYSLPQSYVTSCQRLFGDVVWKSGGDKWFH